MARTLKLVQDPDRSYRVMVQDEETGFTVFNLILRGEDLMVECATGNAIYCLPEAANRVHVREVTGDLFPLLRLP
jgi:hypothetical protein